jgi:hypothetical protein
VRLRRRQPERPTESSPRPLSSRPSCRSPLLARSPRGSAASAKWPPSLSASALGWSRLLVSLQQLSAWPNYTKNFLRAQLMLRLACCGLALAASTWPKVASVGLTDSLRTGAPRTRRAWTRTQTRTATRNGSGTRDTRHTVVAACAAWSSGAGKRGRLSTGRTQRVVPFNVRVLRGPYVRERVSAVLTATSTTLSGRASAVGRPRHQQSASF